MKVFKAISDIFNVKKRKRHKEERRAAVRSLFNDYQSQPLHAMLNERRTIRGLTLDDIHRIMTYRGYKSIRMAEVKEFVDELYSQNLIEYDKSLNTNHCRVYRLIDWNGAN